MEPAASTYKVNFKIIDWMRGLAALFVVFNHSRGMLFTTAAEYAARVEPKAQWHWWEWLNIIVMQHSDLGVEFVILFFILSGFSIAHSLSGEKEIGAFYKRRLVRLYPPYILGIVWSLLVFLIIKRYANEVFMHVTEGNSPLDYYYVKFREPKTLFLNLIYIPNNNYLNSQYWSLPFEIIFYLIIPFCIKQFRLYSIATVLLFTVGMLRLGIYFMDDDVAPIIPQYFLDFNLFFLVGVVLYKYKDRIINRFRLNKWLSLGLIIMLFELLVGCKSYLFHNETNRITAAIMVCFSFLLIFTALKYNVRFRLLEWIGSFSYTLYVTHIASIYLVKTACYRLGLHFYDIYNLYCWLFGILVSVLCAYMLYFVAEYPAIGYLKKLRKKKTIESGQLLPLVNELPE